MKTLLDSKTTLNKYNNDSEYFIMGKNLRIIVRNEAVADIYTDDLCLVHTFTDESKLSDFLNSLGIN
jgi:hypothetical protein